MTTETKTLNVKKSTTNNYRPFISILMPTYNAQNTILRAIKSVLNQTYSFFEFIIINDGSGDDTLNVIKSVEDKRIIYIDQENQGQPVALNNGMKLARGELICFIDSDDQWDLEKLQKQISAILVCPKEVGLVYTNGYRVVENAEKHVDINDVNSSRIVYDSTLRNKNIFPATIGFSCNSSWMIKKTVWETCGEFDPQFQTMHDLGYIVEIGLRFDIYFLNERLVTWYHEGQHLSTINKRHMNCKEYFYKKYYSIIKNDYGYHYYLCRSLAKDWFSIGCHPQAILNWKRAWNLNRKDIKLFFKIIRSFFMNFGLGRNAILS